MASNKKPKKKYIPKPLMYPKLVNQLNSFLPFEQALDMFLETGEVETDISGMFCFKDGLGIIQSFTATLKTYIDIIHIYSVRNNKPINTRPLTILQNRMFEKRGFDEEEFIEAKKNLQICKDIICKITSKELVDYLQTLRTSLKLEEAVDPTLKDPKLLLAKFKHKLGDLTFEDVIEKDKEYQTLAVTYPDDENIQKLKNLYIEFLAAYRFSALK